MPNCYVIYVVAIFICGSVNTFADEFPTVGLLHNTKENHSLSYRCAAIDKKIIECDFIQTSVRKKAHPAELKNVLEKGRDEYKKEKDGMKDCGTIHDLMDILEGRKLAPNKKKVEDIPEIQRKDLYEFTKSMVTFCESKTESNYSKILELSHSKDTRTCLVISNSFSQRFVLIDDHESKTTWVTESKAEGPCGTIQLSRFEPEKTSNGFLFWRYYARKAITNPNGSLFPGVSCSSLDQSEYLYDWRSEEKVLGCDYIEFSPI